MKNLWIPLVALIVLAAASTASAGWVYTATTGWTYTDTVYPAPTVYYRAPLPSVYVYRPPVYTVSPVYTVPTMIAPSPVIRRAPVVVRSRMVVPRRTFRRTYWTVW